MMITLISSQRLHPVRGTFKYITFLIPKLEINALGPFKSSVVLRQHRDMALGRYSGWIGFVAGFQPRLSLQDLFQIRTQISQLITKMGIERCHEFLIK